MKRIVLDIETASNLDRNPDLESCLMDGIKLGNVKDPEKIAAALQEKEAKIRDKAALTAGAGKIVVLGLLIETDGVVDTTIYTDEREGLRALWELLNEQTPPTLITANGLSFDLPYAMQRSWELGIPVSKRVDMYMNKHRDHHFDVLLRWACNQFSEIPSLKRVCLMMEPPVEVPPGDGAEIPALYEEGRIDEIVSHNQGDLKATWEIYGRMNISGESHGTEESNGEAEHLSEGDRDQKDGDGSFQGQGKQRATV